MHAANNSLITEVESAISSGSADKRAEYAPQDHRSLHGARGQLLGRTGRGVRRRHLAACRQDRVIRRAPSWPSGLAPVARAPVAVNSFAGARRVDRGGGAGADHSPRLTEEELLAIASGEGQEPAACDLQARERQRGGQRRAGDAWQPRGSALGGGQLTAHASRTQASDGSSSGPSAMTSCRSALVFARTFRRSTSRRWCPKRRRPCSRRFPPPIRPRRTRQQASCSNSPVTRSARSRRFPPGSAISPRPKPISRGGRGRASRSSPDAATACRRRPVRGDRRRRRDALPVAGRDRRPRLQRQVGKHRSRALLLIKAAELRWPTAKPILDLLRGDS